MFNRRDKLVVTLGIALIFISFLIFFPGMRKLFLSKQPPVGYRNFSPIKIENVNPGFDVSIFMSRLPQDLDITVRMGEYGTQGVGGIVVGNINTGSRDYLGMTFDIPDHLQNNPKVAIRVEAGLNSFAYNWFNNQREGNVPDTGAVPNPLGFEPRVYVDYDQIYQEGQTKIVRLFLFMSPNAGPLDNTKDIQDICFQAFIVNPSFDIVSLSPDCMSPIGNVKNGVISQITWEWVIKPKGDSHGAQQLVFGIYQMMPNQNHIEVFRTRKDVEIKTHNVFEQMKNVNIDTLMTPLTGVITGILGVIAVIFGNLNKDQKKRKGMQAASPRTDYIISVPLKDDITIDAIISAPTKPELRKAKSQINKAVNYGQELLSKNYRLGILSIGYLYDPEDKDWNLSYLKTNKTKDVIKYEYYYEPCHPVQLPYQNGKSREPSK